MAVGRDNPATQSTNACSPAVAGTRYDAFQMSILDSERARVKQARARLA